MKKTKVITLKVCKSHSEMKNIKMTRCFHVIYDNFKENKQRKFLNLHGQFEKLYQDIQTFLSGAFSVGRRNP